ncbi:F-box protein [Senna tora]|uniref:F-box protein n=1 Tax=Senna tora TaxID=362788 RepID=A0A834WH30_9FABA|nr:F-box protein [Senna tora]
MWSEKSFEAKGEKEVQCKISLLDLPEPALDCILECFSPAQLCILAQVCSSLKVRCRNDHLWEKHIKRKWGRVIGDSAYQEWKWHIAIRENENTIGQQVQNGSLGSLSGFWPLLCIGSFLENCRLPGNSLSESSMMAWYISLEKGKFWFPAQVFRSGGLMLYCYDAIVSYDSQTDKFKARYRYSGWRMIEENIEWDRLRAAPAQNPHVRHLFNGLSDLKPGDHVEVQWRSNRELPYDWWYAVIGHLESCEQDNRCHCDLSDMLVIEFRQYSPGSQYRRTVLNKRNHLGEQAVSGVGLYGGIRKLNGEETEIWRKFWPTLIL